MKNDGQTVSFTVPEEGKLELVLTARETVPLKVTLGLEGNKENGVDPLADPLVEKEIVLSKGQKQVFAVDDRVLQGKNEKQASGDLNKPEKQ